MNLQTIITKYVAFLGFAQLCSEFQLIVELSDTQLYCFGSISQFS